MVTVEVNKAIIAAIDELQSAMRVKYNIDLVMSYQVKELTKSRKAHIVRNYLQYRNDIEAVISAAADFFSITTTDILGNVRKSLLVKARQFVIHYLISEKQLTLNDIGKCLNRDHSTVIHHRDKFQTYLGAEQSYYLEWQRFKAYLKGI